MFIKCYWLWSSNIVSREREVHEAQLVFDSKLFNNVSSWKYFDQEKLLLNGLVCEDISQTTTLRHVGNFISKAPESCQA